MGHISYILPANNLKGIGIWDFGLRIVMWMKADFMSVMDLGFGPIAFLLKKAMI